MKIVENYLAKVNFLYRLGEGENLMCVAKRFNLTENVLKSVNNIECAEEGDMIYIPRLNGEIYTVKPMESIKDIAKKFSIREDDIKRINRIENCYTGQKIFILKR